jgi:hypothetical protein
MIDGQIFLEKLNERRINLEHMVAEGQARDYESYRFFIGQIQGLREAIEICQTFITRSIHD